MSGLQYVLSIVAALLVLGVVIEMLRQGRLRERHAMWWLFAGALTLVFAVFPSLLAGLSQLLGFELPVNLVFFLGLFTLFMVVLQHSSELTHQEARNRKLAEEIALLKLRVELLESSEDSR